MINLFEYQNKVAAQDSFEGLEGFLDEIWSAREKNSFYSERMMIGWKHKGFFSLSIKRVS